jgi:hypothetical protein
MRKTLSSGAKAPLILFELIVTAEAVTFQNLDFFRDSLERNQSRCGPEARQPSGFFLKKKPLGTAFATSRKLESCFHPIDPARKQCD